MQGKTERQARAANAYMPECFIPVLGWMRRWPTMGLQASGPPSFANLKKAGIEHKSTVYQVGRGPDGDGAGEGHRGGARGGRGGGES